MLLAHDLLLLLLDDESGRNRAAPVEEQLLGGAMLVQLAAGGWVDVAGRGERVKRRRLVCRPAAPPADPILAAGLDRLRRLEGRRPVAAPRRLGVGLPATVAADLVAAGMLREEHRRYGPLVVRRYPMGSGGYKATLSGQLVDVLAARRAPDSRTGPLIALLGAGKVLTKAVPVDSRRQANRLARDMLAAEWAPEAVRRAVRAANSASSGG